MVAVLIQIDGYDPVAGAPVTLRAASHDDDRLCHLNGVVWWPQLGQLPTLSYDLFDGAFGGKITTPQSELSLAFEAWPNLPRYMLADARIQIWTGKLGAAWAAFTKRFDGRVLAQPAISNGLASLGFAVDDRWLDAPLLALYAGTGGVEGEAALKGQPKPLAIGAPRYAAGLMIDSVNSVVQLSGYGAIQAVDYALDRLVRFGASVGNFASYAALIAATIPAGSWGTCLAAGLARHGAPPEGTLSYLLKGDAAGPDGWVRLPGQVIKRIAILSGGDGRIGETSLDALDAARPWPLSIYVGEQTTARELIQRIAASVNAVAGVDWLGNLFVVPVPTDFGAPELVLDASGSAVPPVSSVEQMVIDAPFWRLAIGAQPTWQVHPLSDVGFTAVLVDRGLYDPAETYREGHIVNLSDGSRWLYTATAPSSGNAPGYESDYWSLLSPAIVPIGPDGSPLASLIAFAQQTADGKSAIFWRETPPSAAESNEGDRWVNKAEGNREYRRVAGSGRLALGADAITLGGAYLDLAWTPSDDQRIGAAVLAAAGAQATADGKVESFTMFNAGDPVPVGEGVGDLLFRLYMSPVQIDRWNGSSWAPASTYGASSAQAAAIADSTAAIVAISSDNVLSKGEKPQFAREWQQAQARYSALDGKAATFGGATIAALRTTLTTKYTALALAIATITPAYNDNTQDSPISGASLQAAWADFYTAYAALDVAISAMTVIVQWSVDGATDWHDDFTAGDKWQRQSGDLGATWDAPVKVVGEDGSAGVNGQYTSTVFIRSAAQPDTPTGAVTPPGGWSDAPPAPGTPALPLWQSQRVFRDGAPVVGSSWSTPIKLIAASLADLDPAAAALLSDAKAIADGKNRIFWQATPPTMAESQPSDWWVNTALGNRTYRRLGGTGVLAIGGNTITLGGNHVVVGWTEMGDTRVAEALQGVADAYALAEDAEAKADSAIADLEALADDGVLSIAEKITTLIPKDAQLEGAWSALDAQAAALGVTTPRTAAASARTAWQSYRNGLSPAWNNTDADTAVSRATFRSTLSAYENALESLSTAIAAKAAVLADWPSITGTGKPETGADVTANNQRQFGSVQAFVVQADSNGVINAGQLGVMTRSFRFYVGTADVSPSTAYAASATGGIAITLNNTAASDQRGDVRLDTLGVESGTITVAATYGGQTYFLQVEVRMQKAAPTIPSSGGGGGSPGSPASTSSLTSPGTNTTHQVMSPVLHVTVGSSGQVNLGGGITFHQADSRGPDEASNPTCVMAVKWQSSVDGTSGWTDVGAEHAADQAADKYYQYTVPKGIQDLPGYVNSGMSKAGLSVGDAYFRLVGRYVSGASGIGAVSGTVVATPV